MGLNIFKKIQHILSFNTKEPNPILSLFLEKKCLFFHIGRFCEFACILKLAQDLLTKKHQKTPKSTFL